MQTVTVVESRGDHRATNQLCGSVIVVSPTALLVVWFRPSAQGHSIGKSIAYAYLPIEHTEPGTKVEIEIFGEWLDGTVAKEPLLDPSGDRIKA